MEKLKLPLEKIIINPGTDKERIFEHKLVIWANSIRAFYGHPIYLVGSQLTEKENPRDIDIVCIIPNNEFELRYGSLNKWCDESGTGVYTEVRWSWADDCLKRSLSGMQETGYSIDFKIQAKTIALGYEDKPKLKLDTR
jgi:hypothetical protein